MGPDCQRLWRWTSCGARRTGAPLAIPSDHTHSLSFCTTLCGGEFSPCTICYVAESFHNQFLYIAMWRRASTISFCILLCGEELPQSVFVSCYVDGSFHSQFCTMLCVREFQTSVSYNAMWKGVSTINFVQCHMAGRKLLQSIFQHSFLEGSQRYQKDKNKQTKANSLSLSLSVCARARVCVWCGCRCGVVWCGVVCGVHLL